MKTFIRVLTCLLTLFSILPLVAEGTQIWRQSRFEDFEKGTSKGVSLPSNGGLELAPALKAVYTSPATYIWALATDRQGNAYIATGTPARVYRITPEGQSSLIFESTELQVQALRFAPEGSLYAGSLYAATSPDGKVYRIETAGAKPAGAKPEKPESAPSSVTGGNGAATASASPASKVDPNFKSSVYYDPKSKYIWDLAVAPNGRLYVATGDHGEIFQVESTGQGSLFFKCDEAHVRVLTLDKLGNLIAGSDGSGLIYRISPQGDGFVLYSAPKKEITSLVVDAGNNIFAAGVGDKRTGGSPPPFIPAPQPPAGGSLTLGGANPSPPANAFNAPAAPTGGSEIYRIAADGSTKRLWSSRDDIVYALAFDAQGRLLAGTGNKGKIFALLNPDRASEYAVLLQISANQVTDFAAAPDGGLYVSTSNLGKLFKLGPKSESEGAFESDVFDAHSFTRWGRAEVRGSGEYEILARSGNVDNPDRNWSPWKKVDLRGNSTPEIPSARFVQWKAVLRPAKESSRIESVIVNYRQKNVAPVIEEIAVQTGARFRSTEGSSQGAQETVMIGFGGSPAPVFPQARSEGSIPAIRDRESVAVRWAAHDDNDDDLVYSVSFRGDGETRWKMLKENITEKFYSWDASLLPDGGYTVRVTASDSPSHAPDEALTDTKISSHFEMDTTPPRIDSLLAKVEGAELHVTFHAVDSFSAISRAEYSVDAGEWQFVEPVGQLSDSLSENYDFTVILKPSPSGNAAGVKARRNNRKKAEGEGNAAGQPEESAEASSEHVVVVRVVDRYDNAATAKTVVRP